MLKKFTSKKGLFKWENTPVLAYKEEGTHFKAITRRILFDKENGFSSQLRYFEIAPGGHSTLERHDHEHGVFIVRGKGKILVGNEVFLIKNFDVVYIPKQTWHQLRAFGKEPLGFLCLVDAERDRPHRPDGKEIKNICRNKKVAGFVRW